MKIEKLSKEATIRELAMRLDELIDAHNESKEPKISHANPNCLDSSRCRPHGEEGPVSYQEPKALEEKDTHGSCACDEKGICKKLGDVLKIVIESNWPDEVKLKETDKVITEHRYHDKPQDEPKECCEKCRGEDGEIAPFCITRVCPCHLQSESIEWDTELDEKYGERNIFGGLWVMDGEKLGQWRLVNDDVRMILRRTITTAVAKAEKTAFKAGFDRGVEEKCNGKH